jgi:hypothetical protein
VTAHLCIAGMAEICCSFNTFHAPLSLHVLNRSVKEPNALPRQQLIANEKVRDSPTLDLQAFRKVEIPSSLRSND